MTYSFEDCVDLEEFIFGLMEGGTGYFRGSKSGAISASAHEPGLCTAPKSPHSLSMLA